MAIAVGLAGGACSDGGTSTADPTVPTAAPTTSSSAPATPDVSVIPATIDEPYLNAVLAALDEIDGQATRIIKSTRSFAKEAAALLNAIYSDEALGAESEVWFLSIAQDPELTGIREQPGHRRSEVDRIIASSPTCIWTAVRRDYSATDVNPGPVRIDYLALQPLDRSNDPTGKNPTAWMIIRDSHLQDGSEPTNPCP